MLIDLDHRKTDCLYILGYYPEYLNILLELANNCSYYKLFDILQNTPPVNPERYVPQQNYQVTFYDSNDVKINVSNTGFKCVLGVIGPKSKEKVTFYFKEKIGVENEQFINLIHTTSYVSATSKLNYGIQIESLTTVNVLAEIGFGVTIKNNCYIGHHVKIGDYVTINPGVVVSGFVEIGKNTLIGAGATIRDGIKIGSNSIIGMGSVVTKDIPDNCMAFGNPCAIQKELK